MWFVELRECCELIESYSQVSQPQFQSPAKSKSGPLDPEVAEIEERLEFPPHVKVICCYSFEILIITFPGFAL